MLSNPIALFGAAQSGASVPRPLTIYIPEGAINSAWQVEGSPHANVPARKKSVAQRAGLAYQKKVGGHLRSCIWPRYVVDGPWFAFSDRTPGRHYCQPDFLIMDYTKGAQEILIVEVKLRWTSDAWWQLRRLYEPVVGRANSGAAISVLCITKSFDPAVRCEEEVALIDSLEDAKPEAFNVLVLR